MKEEHIKLLIVLSVAVAALIGLFLLMNADFSPAMTGAVVAGYSDNSNTAISSEDIVVTELPASAGCCNWDCDNYHWTCRTRSMQCSIGKPVFICRK